MIENGNILFLDGGMGSMLASCGLDTSTGVDEFNISHPEIVTEIHRRYIEAGSRVIITNTLCTFPYKHDNYEEIIKAALQNVRAAAASCGGHVYAALDMGPTGKLLEPMGDYPFDACYDAYRRIAVCGEKNGADLALIETMSDLYEVKAAILAVKENTNLPVFCTMTFDANGRTLTGCDVKTFVITACALGADAVGINCSLGPWQIMGLVNELVLYSTVPVIVQPNAGLPEIVDGKTVYSLTPDEFATCMLGMFDMGVRAAGGCCGTTPEHIRAMVNACSRVYPTIETMPLKDICTSYSKAIRLTDAVITGRITNPRIKEAVSDIDYFTDAALDLRDDGVDIIEIDVSCPGVDEEALLPKVIFAIQEMINTPLAINASSPRALNKALRRYNGRAAVSLSGKSRAEAALFIPVAARYGGVVLWD